jgi:hypothetical protein
VQICHADVICDTDCLAALRHYLETSWFLLEKSMRMPILSYFLVVGLVLFGGLVLVSSQLESKPLPVSQRIGLPTPFKALPEDNQSLTSNGGEIIP